ncbi:flippase [Photobacterium leiognathi]|uniref:flippase n=1 Tax=Photobacterium leiognathi TaxID=553611 RepID=UPI0029814376|nr:flippase [Photobacterium leiognathi]
MYSKYLKSLKWNLFEKIIRLIITFFVTSYIAKSLGPALYGVFSLSQSVVSILAVISSFGLDYILNKEFSSGEHKTNEIIGTSLFLRFIGWVVSLFVAIPFLYFISTPGIYVFVYILMLIPLFQVSSSISIYFTSKGCAQYNFIPNLLSLIIFSILKILVVYLDGSILSLCMVFSIEQFLLLILLFLQLNKNGVSFKSLKISKDIFNKLIKVSWPIAISSAIIILYSRLDQVMISYFLDSKNVGLYSVAVRISDISGFLPSLIVSSFFPILVKKKRDQTIDRNDLLKFFSIIFYSGLITVSFIYILSNYVVSIFFGEQYSEVINIMPLYLVSLLFSYSGFAVTQWLILEELTKYRLYRTILGLLLNILLNIYFIPIYGIYGALYSTLISQLFSSYLSNYMSEKTRYIFYIQSASLIYPLIFLFTLLKSKYNN